MNNVPRKSAKAAKPTARPASAESVLLSGANPQIAKGYGDAPVQAYIAAMPGWKAHTALREYRARLLARPSITRVVDEARPWRENFPLKGHAPD